MEIDSTDLIQAREQIQEDLRTILDGIVPEAALDAACQVVVDNMNKLRAQSDN